MAVFCMVLGGEDAEPCERALVRGKGRGAMPRAGVYSEHV